MLLQKDLGKPKNLQQMAARIDFWEGRVVRVEFCSEVLGVGLQRTKGENQIKWEIFPIKA